MGNRYYAKVTFPSGAKKVAEVGEWLISPNNDCYKIDDDDQMIEVNDDQANYGAIEITDLLDEHHVPYDHYHSESEGSEGSFTAFVRWRTGPDGVAAKLLAEPVKVEIGLSNVSEEMFTKASQVLAMWDTIGIEAARAELERMKALLPEPLDPEWAP